LATSGYSASDIKAIVDEAAEIPWVEAKRTEKRKKTVKIFLLRNSKYRNTIEIQNIANIAYYVGLMKRYNQFVVFQNLMIKFLLRYFLIQLTKIRKFFYCHKSFFFRKIP